jgi:dolichol-phosphate mannosyltransferase
MIGENYPYLYVVVPVFNERPNLDRLFASFARVEQEFHSRYQLQFLLVDDGSTDGTATRAQELTAELNSVVLSNPTNQGPGAAFARAFAFLAPRLTDPDWVLTLEGDNTSRLELMRQMFHRTEEGFDVVLASPYMYGGGITNTTALRVLMSHMANAFVKELLGAHGLLTISSFFRLYRAPVILRLQAAYGPAILESHGFECMAELLLKMVYHRVTISEVPMLLDAGLRAGKSKMKVLKTIRGYLALGRRTAAWRSVAAARVAEGMQVTPGGFSTAACGSDVLRTS